MKWSFFKLVSLWVGGPAHAPDLSHEWLHTFALWPNPYQIACKQPKIGSFLPQTSDQTCQGSFWRLVGYHQRLPLLSFCRSLIILKALDHRHPPSFSDVIRGWESTGASVYGSWQKFFPSRGHVFWACPSNACLLASSSARNRTFCVLVALLAFTRWPGCLRRVLQRCGLVKFQLGI